MQKAVLSYTNPDLDGVACSLAIAALDPTWQARMLGKLDEETSLVLGVLGILAPTGDVSWGEVREIWLVDTHHKKQLPDNFPHNAVSRVTDHHPGGDVALFSAARIQNEAVGAAATLVVEMFIQRQTPPKQKIAQLLQAAIISNTLEFRAPSTTERDKSAYSYLRSISELAESLIRSMSEARRGVMRYSTIELLRRDAKSFDTPHGLIAVAQIEAPGALEVLDRNDLRDALILLRNDSGAKHALLSVVDTSASKGAIVGEAGGAITIIAEGLGVEDPQDGIIRLNRLVQRKTDVIPHIIKRV